MRNYLFVCIFTASLPLWAQQDTTSSRGEIVMGEVIVEKDRQIILPQIDKLYQRAALKKFENETLNVSLEVDDPQLIWPPYKSEIPFQPNTKPYPESKYQNYLRLGYGNYKSPLAEIGVFKKFGAFQTSGMFFYKHFQSGPINEENSSNSTGLIDLSGTYKSDHLQVTPAFRFQNNQYRFYGNTNRVNSGFDKSPLPKVNFSNLDLSAKMEGSNSNNMSYYLTPTFNTTKQIIKNGEEINQETVIGAIGGTKLKIDEQFIFGLDVEGYSSDYRSGITYNRSLFLLRPRIQYNHEDFSFSGGFNLASGKSDSLRQSGFYPHIHAEWGFDEKWSLYGKLTGNIKWHGLKDLLNENEFLDDSVNIRNIENTIEFSGGIEGSPITNLMMDVNIGLINQNNLPFYVPSPGDSARFIVVFDDQAINRARLKTSLSYSPTTTSTYTTSLELNSFSVNSLERPWHLPTYILTFSTSHNIRQKVLFSVDLISMGGIKAPANVDFGILNLPSFMDIGFSLSYLITERASVCLDVNNMINNEYERYLGYPVRAINFNLGGQYRF